GLGVNVSQPLVRDFKIDAARQQLAVSRTNRDIAETRLRESLVHTTASVKAAYWNLVSARANVDARKSALELAQELVRVNKAKVDVGTSPPLDLVSAQAEVASDQEQLIIAETSVRQAEDRLRMLIMDPTERETWTTVIEATDSPPIATPTIDVEAAVTRALAERADLQRSRKDIENAQTSLNYLANQKLPDVRVNASYQASGLRGTPVLRTRPVRRSGRDYRLRIGRRPAVRARLSDVGGRPQRVVPDWRERRPGQLRARSGGARAGRPAVQRRRGAGDSTDSHRRLSSGHERQ